MTFYDSTLRYDIGKDVWKEYKSGSVPAPRSSAAGVCVPGMGEGGGIVIFGELVSLCLASGGGTDAAKGESMLVRPRRASTITKIW